MATFIKTGALVRRTHRPIAIFLSRPLYLYEQCKRWLQSSNEILIEHQAACDEQAKHVDMLCFTKAASPVEFLADESGNNRTVRPVALEADPESNEANVSSNTSEVDNILKYGGESEDANADRTDTDSVQPAQLHVGEVDTDGDVQLVESQAGVAIHNEDAQQTLETLDTSAKAEAFEENLDIAALGARTSAHDDWLHGGAFVFDMDFHTYH